MSHIGAPHGHVDGSPGIVCVKTLPTTTLVETWCGLQAGRRNHGEQKRKEDQVLFQNKQKPPNFLISGNRLIPLRIKRTAGGEAN